jgi:hypothetical protein
VAVLVFGPRVIRSWQDSQQRKSDALLIASERERKLEMQRRTKASPLRRSIPIKDGGLMEVKVRPTEGDSVPSDVLSQLELYAATKVGRKRFHRKIHLEYRNGEWHEYGTNSPPSETKP